MKPLNTKLEKEFSFAGFEWPRYIGMLPRRPLSDRISRYKKPVTGNYYTAPVPIVGGRHPGTSFYLDSDFQPVPRWRWCDDVVKHIQHTGWFADDYQDTTIRGLVFRLNHDRGFLAGWSMGAGMATSVDGTIYTDEETAAYAADKMAENIAEEERERQATEEGEEESEGS